MKSARNTLPTPESANGVTGGIDWARDDHAVSVVDAPRPRNRAAQVEHNVAGLPHWSPCSRAPASLRSRSSAPTGRSSTRCSTPGDGGGDQPQPGQEPAWTLRFGRQQGRPVRRVRARRHPAHRPSTAAPAAARHPGHGHPAPDLPRPQRPRRPPGRRGQPAARAPENRVPRRGRFVRRPRLADQPGVPDPLRLPRPRRLALGQTPGRLAGQRRLQRPHRPFGALPPAHQRTARHRRNRRHRHHRRLRGRAVQPGRPDQGSRRRYRRTTRPPRRRADLHLPVALGHLPRGPPAQRDRGSAEPASPPRNRWPAWPESRPPPASPEKSNTSDSVGPQTNNSAKPSPTSPATADTPTPGLPTCTTAPSPEDTTTPTPSASSPAPGSTSSGTAGKRESAYDPTKHRALQTLLNQAQHRAA